MDPLNPYSWDVLGLALCFNGEMHAARNALIRTGEFAPGYDWPAFWLGAVDLLEGQSAKALARYEHVSTGWVRRTGVAMAHHDLGHAKESQSALEELVRENASDSPYQIAEVYTRRGELDRAFEWLDRAYALPDPGLIYVKSDPLMRNLHGDPRYRPFLKKVNLPLD